MEGDDLKLFLRVDGTEDDLLIQSLQTAAEKYLANAGVIKDYTNELYSLAIKLLVSHWYENRQIEHTGTTLAKLSFSLEAIITQLKYCIPPVEDGGIV